MEFENFISTIVESDAEDWHRDHCGGPYFSYALGPVTQNDRLINLDYNAHESRAVYKPDIDISLEWGLRHLDDFKEPWAQTYSHDSAMSKFVDLNYRGRIVHRELVVFVDGARCILPPPMPEDDDGNLKVPRSQVKFTKLLNALGGTGEFDHYFRHSGMVAVEVPWP